MGRIGLDYPGGPNVIPSVFITGRQESQSPRRRCDGGSRGQVMSLLAGSWEPRKEGSLKELESSRTEILHLSSQKKHKPASTLILAP